MEKDKELVRKVLIDFIDEIKKCYSLDYFIEELKTSVEFHGDYFHANPKKYGPDHKFPGFVKNGGSITAKELWEKDSKKYSSLEKYHGIRTIIVWESDYYKNKDNENFYKEIQEIDFFKEEKI
jgi:G:T-mismatch repair DNA endonuclease (very short patch repair protein)